VPTRVSTIVRRRSSIDIVISLVMIALQPALTGAPIDGATVIGLLVFGAVAWAPLLNFARATNPVGTEPSAQPAG
jgi:hypothetical protein